MSEYKKHQYSKQFEAISLHQKTNSTGQVIQATETRLQHFNINLANTQGMKKVKYNHYSDIGPKVIASQLDAELFFYITKHQNSTSMLTKASSTDLATSKYLASRFDVTPQKIRGFMRKCVENGLLKKLKHNYIINPYILSPYNCKNYVLHQLQLWWDTSPTTGVVLEDIDSIDVTLPLGVSDVTKTGAS